MLIEFTRAEPCVIGEIHDEIRSSLSQSARQIGIGVFVTDESAESGRTVVAVYRENSAPFPGNQRRIEGNKFSEERK